MRIYPHIEWRMVRKTLFILALGVFLTLALAPIAGAQGNDIACPEGAASNAAGTHCTDIATGLEVEPVWTNTVFPDGPATNTCPELMTKENGRCVDIPGLQNIAPASPQVFYDWDYGAWYYLYSDGSWAWY